MIVVAISSFTGSENPLSEGGIWRTGDSFFGFTNPLQKVSGLAKSTSTGVVCSAVYQGTTIRNNQYLKVVLNLNTSGSWGLALFLRYSPFPQKGYFVDIDNTGAAAIKKFESGAETTLVSTTITLNSTETITFEIDGTTLNLYRGANLLLTTTNSVFASGEAALILSASSSIDDIAIDSFEVGDDRVPLIVDLVDNSQFEIVDERVF